MHNLPFSIRVRGTIESLKNEMEMTKGTEEFNDWTPLIKSLERVLDETNTQEEPQATEPDFVAATDDTDDYEAW
jgi:hypothetical protein